MLDELEVVGWEMKRRCGWKDACVAGRDTKTARREEMRMCVVHGWKKRVTRYEWIALRWGLWTRAPCETKPQGRKTRQDNERKEKRNKQQQGRVGMVACFLSFVGIELFPPVPPLSFSHLLFSLFFGYLTVPHLSSVPFRPPVFGPHQAGGLMY